MFPLTVFGLVCSCLGLLIGIGGTVLWIWMLVDCLINESPQGNDKVIWAIVILVTHFLGAALYLLIRRPQRIRELGR
jgi:hypothetical protein